MISLSFDRYLDLAAIRARSEVIDPIVQMLSSPSFNQEETDAAYILTLDLPGYKKTEVALELSNNNILTLAAISKTDKHKRVAQTLTLDNTVDVSAISSKLEDGVLTVTLPKVVRPKPRVIPIT